MNRNRDDIVRAAIVALMDGDTQENVDLLLLGLSTIDLVKLEDAAQVLLRLVRRRLWGLELGNA
jgi:hypothetical protein